MTESLTLESGGCFDLLKIGHNQNNDLDSPHPLSIMSAIYPITGIDCIAMSSHSMYLNLYIFNNYKGSGGWVQKYVGLWAGWSGRVVEGPLFVVVSRGGDVPMSLTRAESRRRSVCDRAAVKDLIKNSFYVERYCSSTRERTIICLI